MYYFLAFFTIMVWSFTFVSTKALLLYLSPEEIMFFRFVIAYIVLLLLHPKFYPVQNKKTEFYYGLAGFFGGSLYFFTENYALKYTLATNVGLITAGIPIITAFLAHFMVRGEPLKKQLFIGGILAFIGVAFVIFNGQVVLQISPIGDLLAGVAALSFAFYSIFIKLIQTGHSAIYVTRKVFFYSVLTSFPFLIFGEFTWDLERWIQPVVLGNLFFLGIVASGLCFVVWNQAIYVLGAVKTNHFIYFVPFLTMLFAWLFLNESITIYALLGLVFIICGVYIAERPEKQLPKKRINHLKNDT